MSLIQDLNDTPSGDKFQELYDKFNANNAWFVRTGLPGLTVSGNNLTLHREGGGSETVALPVGGDRIINGLIVTITGAGPYTVNIAPGQWSIGGITYTLSTPQSTPLATPDPVLDRIDAVFATNTGTVVYVAGVASLTPAAPVPGPGQLLVNYISVPAAGQPGPVAPTLTLPPGTLDGQVLLWDAPTGQWTISTLAFINNDSSGDITTKIELPGGLAFLAMQRPKGGNGRFWLYSRHGSASLYQNFLDGNNGQLSLRRITTGLGLQNEVTITDVGIDIAATGPNQFIKIDSDDGIEITAKTLPPTTPAGRLYRIGTDLYWSGAKICVAPCGGYNYEFQDYDSAGTYTIAPSAGTNEFIARVGVTVTPGGPVILNLPASPTPFLKVVVKAAINASATARPIQINGNGNKIENTSNPYFIDTDLGSVTFMFIGTGPIYSSWQVI